VQEPVTFARSVTAHGALPKNAGLAAVLLTAGLILVIVALRGDAFAFGAAAQLPMYCLALLFMGGLTWWEASRRRSGVLPAWTSPPALIAGWTFGWIYGPALAAFLDNDLIDDLTMAKGGEAVLLAGVPLTCGALAILTLSYHLTMLALGRRVRTATERRVPLRRILGLYVIGTLARAARLQTLGIAFGAELSAWGPLQSLDQWIGYAEDLRVLALALLVTHIVRLGSGRIWLGIALFVELVMAVSSGFIAPAIMPVVLCVVTVATFNRLNGRHIALVAAAAIVVSTFVPVIAAIREDRLGIIGTADRIDAGQALTAPLRYWLAGVSGGDGVYAKFFGRQAEVASAAGLVVMFTPAIVPFEGFEQFLMLPANLIPRLFWPGKPTLSRGVWFSTVFRGLDEDTSSSSAMTIFSEGYLFYGWTGAALAMLIAGSLLAVLRRRLDTPQLLVVYLALVPSILQIEPELSSYLTALVQRSLVFVVVFVLLSYSKFGYRQAPP
jgi:hypothetical protein